MVLRHVKRLVERYPNTFILFTPETNYSGGLESTRLADMVSNFPNVHIYRGQKESRRGFLTTAENKYAGAKSAQMQLYRGACTIHPELKSTPEGLSMVEEFKRHLARIEDRQTISPNGTVHHQITGKFMDNGQRDEKIQDDLAILFVLSQFIYDQTVQGLSLGMAKNYFEPHDAPDPRRA